PKHACLFRRFFYSAVFWPGPGDKISGFWRKNKTPPRKKAGGVSPRKVNTLGEPGLRFVFFT
ncbi:hypothetical protein ACNIS7_28210, partial [Escherichia coli]